MDNNDNKFYTNKYEIKNDSIYFIKSGRNKSIIYSYSFPASEIKLIVKKSSKDSDTIYIKL